MYACMHVYTDIPYRHIYACMYVGTYVRMFGRMYVCNVTTSLPMPQLTKHCTKLQSLGTYSFRFFFSFPTCRALRRTKKTSYTTLHYCLGFAKPTRSINACERVSSAWPFGITGLVPVSVLHRDIHKKLCHTHAHSARQRQTDRAFNSRKRKHQRMNQ